MTASTIWEHTLVHHLWTKFQTWKRFKFTLPKTARTTLETVHLNVANLPSVLKNNIIEGRYEVQERVLASRFLTSEDRVLEFGSAIGFIGLFCQKRLGIRDYAGIEANPHTLRLAEENYALNGVAPRLTHAAVAAEDGTISLNMHRDFWRDSVVSNDAGTTPTPVPARTLGTIVAGLSFQPTVLIADIEGAEQQILWSELPASVRTVIMELHPHVIGHPETYRVIADLQREGFVVAAEEDGTYAFTRP